MELTSIIEMARTQGTVFWAGAVAVALGATLLVVAVAQQLGRIAAARLAARRPGGVADVADETDTYTPSMPPQPAADVEATLDAVAAVTREAEQPHAEQSLALLLRRLQSAGDRLEEISRDVAMPADADQTALKDTLEDVEYVFKACSP